MDLIIDSFLYQYNIYLPKVKNEEMTWREFLRRVGGFDEKSPLARMVQIRTEDNKEVVKNWNEREKKINQDWKQRKYNDLMTSPDLEKHMELQNRRIAMFLDSCTK